MLITVGCFMLMPCYCTTTFGNILITVFLKCNRLRQSCITVKSLNGVALQAGAKRKHLANARTCVTLEHF